MDEQRLAFAQRFVDGVAGHTPLLVEYLQVLLHELDVGIDGVDARRHEVHAATSVHIIATDALAQIDRCPVHAQLAEPVVELGAAKIRKKSALTSLFEFY